MRESFVKQDVMYKLSKTNNQLIVQIQSKSNVKNDKVPPYQS